MATIVVILGIVVVIVTIGAFLLTRKHPEQADVNSTGDRGSNAYYGDVNDRLGSPGAEDDGVPERGSPAPGPSAEALPDSPTQRN